MTQAQILGGQLVNLVENNRVNVQLASVLVRMNYVNRCLCVVGPRDTAINELLQQFFPLRSLCVFYSVRSAAVFFRTRHAGAMACEVQLSEVVPNCA